MVHACPALIADLRSRIARIERVHRPHHSILSFGVAALDDALPERGLMLGALHEMAGAGQEGAAALFAAGILARMEGPVLWCRQRRDLFAPGLAGAGLHPDRVIYADAHDDRTVLFCLEEGLHHTGLAGAVGEVSRLSMTVSRRLQLAAEASGVTAFILRRQAGAKPGKDFGQLTAAATRWRIDTIPSARLPVPGLDRARWRVELLRVRGGEGGIWELEGCDAQGRLALPADLADRSAEAADGRRRAAA